MATPDKKWKPVGSFGLQVAAWCKSKQTTFTVNRSYFKDGEWKRTEFLSAGDMLALAALAPELVAFAQRNADNAAAAPAAAPAVQPEPFKDGDDIPF